MAAIDILIGATILVSAFAELILSPILDFGKSEKEKGNGKQN